MDNLFLALALLSAVAFILGLIRPSWVRMPSRKRASIVFGVVIIVFFTLFGITTPAKPNAAGSQSDTKTSTAPVSDDEKLKAITATVFSGKTNSSNEARLRTVKVVPQGGGGYGVFVEFNGNDNLTTKLTKSSIEKDMSDLYIALYTSGLDVRAASAAAYFPLTDKYGNTSDGIVYKSELTKDDADKVNWSADKATLELQILPGVWSTSFVNQEFR